MLSTISIDENEKWDKTVMSLSFYSKAFSSSQCVTILILYEKNDTRAMNVILKRDIAYVEYFKDTIKPNQWFDIITPYGYGGFWIEGEEYSSLEDEYIEYCKKNNYISEFVRFHLFSNYHNVFKGLVESNTNNIVRSLTDDLDEIFMNFDHKVRKNIKKAQRAGLRVEIDYTGKMTEDFLDIYYSTMHRNNANSAFFFKKEFFEYIEKMMDNHVYFYVIYEGNVISTELVLYSGDNCYSFLGGTKSEYFSLRPNDFLKYEIIKWAKYQGFKRFVLGGGHGEDDGIYKYKKSFAPDGIKKFYIGKRIFNIEKYNELVKIRESTDISFKDIKFFPEYRAAKE